MPSTFTRVERVAVCRSALRAGSFHYVDTALGARGAVREKKAQTSERGHGQLPEAKYQG